MNKDSTAATISYYNYSYDNADRVTVQSGTGTTGTYTYDAASQVTNDGTATYSYDSNGNRTMSGYAVGSNNQVATDGTFTYTYDAAGNMIEKSKGTGQETWFYTYDNENHLTVVRKTSDGTTNTLLVTYTYDVYGQRTEQQEWQSGGSTVTTEYVWSNGQVIMDLNGSNVVQERYLWGDTQDQTVCTHRRQRHGLVVRHGCAGVGARRAEQQRRRAGSYRLHSLRGRNLTDQRIGARGVRLARNNLRFTDGVAVPR